MSFQATYSPFHLIESSFWLLYRSFDRSELAADIPDRSFPVRGFSFELREEEKPRNGNSFLIPGYSFGLSTDP